MTACSQVLVAISQNTKITDFQVGGLEMKLTNKVAAAALIAFSASIAPAQQPEQQAAPPIGPGEIYFETANHCGVVFTRAEIAKFGRSLADLQKNYRNSVWQGRCVGGLVDGRGQFAAPGGPISDFQMEYILGRSILDVRMLFGTDRVAYLSGGKIVTIYNGAEAFGPHWAYYSETLYGADTSNSIEAANQRCMYYDLAKKTKKFGCSYSNNYRAYSIVVRTAAGKTTKRLICPDPRTPVGCEQLWLTAGKHVFDDIKAFIAPLDAELAARRSRYQALITPEWRAHAEGKRAALLANGSADQLNDEIASLVMVDDMDGAVKLSQQLSNRFPGSTAIAQSKQRLTTGYCRRARPALTLTYEEALIWEKLYSEEPCKNSDIAATRRKLANSLIEFARQQKAEFAADDRRAAAYIAQQRADQSASWAATLGVLTQVLANDIAPSPRVPSYSGGSAPTPSYAPPGSSSSGSANRNMTGSGGLPSRVIARDGQHAMNCVRLVTVAAGDSRTTGLGNRVLSNQCGVAVSVGWCYVGGECERESGNMTTIQAGRSWPVSYEKEIRFGACRGANTIHGDPGSKGLSFTCSKSPD
jgi:hypothetical protein